MELHELTGAQIGRLVNSRKVSPTEVINYFVNRIEAHNDDINAYVYLEVEDALNEAKELESRLSKGEYCGPFAGVPVGLKDFLPSKKGWKNSHGGVASLIRTDDADSMFYSAARELGAIAIGKTNAPPFGFKGTCDNKLYGPTHNPFNLKYNSGGSSGGSAAAVAAGFSPICEGGDAGGSIRIPSAWCNCFGYKAGLGTVPSYCRPDGWTATHPYCFNGGITRSVEDSAILMTQMAQYNPRDPISLPINSNKDFLELSKESIKGMRIGYTSDFNLFPADPEVASQVESAAMQLKDAGAIVEPVTFNFKHALNEFARCWCWAISVDTALDIAHWEEEGLDLLKDHKDELTKEFIQYNLIANVLTIVDFRYFNEIRTDILDAFEDVFESYDVILSPVTCCKPLTNISGGRACKDYPELQLNPTLDFIEFGETFLVNFVGYPAASVPVGFVSNNLPIGMQVIGKMYRDEDVFKVSHTIESMNPWDYSKLMLK